MLITYSKAFIEKAKIVNDGGVNIYALIGRYYKQSKLNKPLPEEVMMGVLDEFIKRNEIVREPFPYFLQVLKSKSEMHFANKNQAENNEYKKQRANVSVMRDILKGMFNG